MRSRVKMSKLYTSRTQEQEATRRRPAYKSTDTSFANDTEAGFESEAASPALYVFPALKIGRVDSPEERTADEVAHRVLGGGVVGPGGVARAGEAAGLPVSPAIAGRIQARSGQGESLPDAEREFFEPRFGRGFGDVTIHRDGEAASLARSLNAKAFTVGSDIYFGSGQYSQSENGRRLMAHELTHTMQQGAGVQREVGKCINRQESSQKDEHTALQERIDRIEQRYREMVLESRRRGYNVAAENLEYFLNGSGKTRILPVTWLRSFDGVREAEIENRNRFEIQLSLLALQLVDKETKFLRDYWDSQFTASVLDELYYASGTSTLRSTGTFRLYRNGDNIWIEGSVDQYWYDPYDWHAGLSAYIPNFGNISDEDALLMQQYRGAKPFLMQSFWKQNLIASITISDFWFDKQTYRWSRP